MKSLYRNLALSGIKRNKNIFMPFIGTIIFLIVLNSICLSLVLDKSLEGASGMETMKIFLFYGVVVLSIFSLIMLSSVYSFIQKRKLKEQGLLFNTWTWEKASANNFILGNNLYYYFFQYSSKYF